MIHRRKLSGPGVAGHAVLALVAALMLLFSPFLLWDVSFQLSFIATLGLVLYSGVITAAFTRLASQRIPEATAQRSARVEARVDSMRRAELEDLRIDCTPA